MPYGYTNNAPVKYNIDTKCVTASCKAHKAGNISDKEHIKNLWNARIKA